MLIDSLPNDDGTVNMGKPRTDEERKAQNQKHTERDEQRRKAYVLPDHLKEPVVFPKSVYERFSTRMLLDGKEVEVLIIPEPGNAMIEGLPTVYCIDIDHTFFAWLRYTSEGWTMNPERSQEIADLIGNVVQTYYE